MTGIGQTDTSGVLTTANRILTPDTITLKPGKEKEGRQLIVDILLHTADISFPVRSFGIAWKWANRLAEEFANQVKNEKEQGLPVLPFMEPGDEKVLAKGEMGFIDYIVQPLFTSICSFLPEMVCSKSSSLFITLLFSPHRRHIFMVSTQMSPPTLHAPIEYTSEEATGQTPPHTR